jgi:hypothetical protein
MTSIPSSPGAIDRRHIALAAGFVLLTMSILWMMGRVPVCACGSVKFWFGPITSDETSQHFTDWYSFTHITHGLLFYAGLWLLFSNWTLGARLVAAIAIEGAWEVFENTSFIIDRYRELTYSLDYYGDSMLNSLGDLAAMIVGFLLATRLPLKASILLGIVIEIVLGFVIRDNLTLNVVMLLWPTDFIKDWQMGIYPTVPPG